VEAVKRFFGELMQGVAGIIVLPLMFIAPLSWVYALFREARDGSFIGFLFALVVPPWGVIRGVIWFLAGD